MIKSILTIVGALLALIGAVWSLQGANVIGGSFMTGQSQWLIIGLVCLVVGIAMLVVARLGSRA